VHERIELAKELDADLGEGGAGVVPQGDPVADRVRRRRYRVLERSGKARVRLRLRGDPVGIEPIGLPLVTAPLADRCLVRRHIAHVASGRDEELGQVPAQPAGALDAPAIGRAEPGSPRQAGVMPLAGVREVSVSELTAARVEHGRGECLAVRVDADDVGCRHVVASRVLAVGGRDRATTSQSRGSTLSSGQHGPRVTVPGSTLQAADSHPNEVAPEISFESGLGTVTHRTGRRRGPSGRHQSNTGISLFTRSNGFVSRMTRETQGCPTPGEAVLGAAVAGSRGTGSSTASEGRKRGTEPPRV
jgi:hypothetical protein